MASKFFDLSIQFIGETPDFNCAVRKREAPENYKISEEEVRAIINKEFHGGKNHLDFSFSATKTNKEKFNKSNTRIVIEADFEKYHPVQISTPQAASMA